MAFIGFLRSKKGFFKCFQLGNEKRPRGIPGNRSEQSQLCVIPLFKYLDRTGFRIGRDNYFGLCNLFWTSDPRLVHVPHKWRWDHFELTSHCIEITSDLVRRNVVSILFEDPRPLKAQLFLVPHDTVSDPKSVNIDILNGEEINHVRNCDQSFVVLAGETESDQFCFQVLGNQSRWAEAQSM
jgi:hypothetical protein